MALRATDFTLLFIAFSSSEVRTSPAMTTRLVVASVSQATRTPWIHAGLRGLAEEQIDHLVGDAVAHLVGMSLGHGFAGEQIVGTGHCRFLQVSGCGLVGRMRFDAPARERRVS